jgi:hypothetical protein
MQIMQCIPCLAIAIYNQQIKSALFAATCKQLLLCLTNFSSGFDLLTVAIIRHIRFALAVHAARSATAMPWRISDLLIGFPGRLI